MAFTLVNSIIMKSKDQIVLESIYSKILNEDSNTPETNEENDFSGSPKKDYTLAGLTGKVPKRTEEEQGTPEEDVQDMVEADELPSTEEEAEELLGEPIGNLEDGVTDRQIEKLLSLFNGK